MLLFYLNIPNNFEKLILDLNCEYALGVNVAYRRTNTLIPLLHLNQINILLKTATLRVHRAQRQTFNAARSDVMFPRPTAFYTAFRHSASERFNDVCKCR